MDDGLATSSSSTVRETQVYKEETEESEESESEDPEVPPTSKDALVIISRLQKYLLSKEGGSNLLKNLNSVSDFCYENIARNSVQTSIDSFLITEK